ncbi:MAG: hypothetical protein ACNI3C_07235 [Candidatus Marinarcus sp.]|uniref:tetratricopeptide repeat protein n=1 Tax=Candidatus Marinarcus sp. TaxID=3100987 RepID=UPI003AFF836E
MKLFILLSLLLTIFLHAQEGDTLESQPNIIFTYDKLKKKQTNFALQVDFNKAVLLLTKGEYEEAIKILKNTAEVLKIPSFLNIGIAYYKLNSYHNATVYLKQIYNIEEAIYNNPYSFMSASYYLYKITNEKRYLESIIFTAKKNKILPEDAKRMLADTFILLKDYKSALKVLDAMKSPMDLKKGLIYLKLNDYSKSEALLERAYKDALDEKRIDTILWFMVYRDLKSNNLTKLQEHLTILDERKNHFLINRDMPILITFNPYKYSTKEYLDFVTNYSLERKINMIFYFAPFVFSDKEEIIYDSSKGFIFNSAQNLQSLENMVKYNAKFINLIKMDPIIRVQKLQNLIRNEDTKSYIYYNLALSYAQISDYNNAYKYFNKSYKLNPGNKLYAVMTLICAKIMHMEVKDEKYIETNITSKQGLYKYFGQTLYKEFINQKADVSEKPHGYSSTILHNALQVIEKLNSGKKLNGNEDLFTLNYKDPLVYLMHLVIRKSGENSYAYVSRLQDTIPLTLNDNFLEGSLIITNFYVDVLKGLAMFDKAEFNIDDYYSPSYLRTKALDLLHNNNSQATINILEYLQQKYKLQDKYTLYMMVAALLESGKYEEASLQISFIKALLNDSGANFLTGVQLVQELKINSAKQFFAHPYTDTLIDFDIKNLDVFMESL